MEQKSNKTIVLECYRKIIRDLDLSLVDSYVHDDYIQHSPMVKDGKAGLLEMLEFLKKLPQPAKPEPSPIIRAVEEGDLVAVHLDIQFMGQRVAVVDLFRLAGGKIAEHWDVGQPLVANDDGLVTMTNGRASIDGNCDAEPGKKLVRAFFEERFADRDLHQGKYFTAGYVEHNTAGLLNNGGRRLKVHQLIGEGDFIVAHVESINRGRTYAEFHLFRTEGDKLAEHWSVQQAVPDVMAHGNGMF
ncbi:MAG: nuclear transport factor 2 family protein [Mucilaginibacter sp.]